MRQTRVGNLTESELQRLQDMHQEGRTISYIALAINKSIATVWRGIRRLEQKQLEKQRRRHLYGTVEKKPSFTRPPTEYSNRSPYGIASPGIQQQ